MVEYNKLGLWDRGSSNRANEKRFLNPLPFRERLLEQIPRSKILRARQYLTFKA